MFVISEKLGLSPARPEALSEESGLEPMSEEPEPKFEGPRLEPMPESQSEGPGLEPLPEGWVPVIHESGGELYLHKESRTCTWSRPFVLGHSVKVKVSCADYLVCIM